MVKSKARSRSRAPEISRGAAEQPDERFGGMVDISDAMAGATLKATHELEPFCGWCYAHATADSKMLRCGKCKKRVYCSKACQISDWKDGAHKHWCGKAGELGHDIAVRATESKGNALFAMRKIERGEKIMVERAAATKEQCATCTPASVPAGMVRAAAALMPRDNPELGSKFALNAFDMDDGAEGLFIHMAYANHSCIPNAVHHSVASQGGVKLLVAGRTIEAGEEITHAYVSLEGEVRLAASGKLTGAFLQEVWGFNCTCEACTQPAKRARLTRMRELDACIVACTMSDVREPDGPRRFDEALRAGDELIALYDELRLSPNHYARTYYLLFQLGVTRRATLAQARKHVALAREARVLLVGEGTVCEEVAKLKKLESAPETHNAYLAGEP